MKKLILVTGAHRSGSTWVGKIINAAYQVRYVHEPFNIGIKRNNNPLIYWFEYLNESTSLNHQNQVKNYLKSFILIKHTQNIRNVFKIRSLRSGYKFFIDIQGRVADRTLIKDPIAIMSAEWIYKNFNSDIIITIRHPAAFVASLKVKDWQFDFNNFLGQKELMQTYLSHFSNSIENQANNKQNIINQGILLWNSIYTTVLKYKEIYEDTWYFVKHEDLSNDPLNEYEKLFNFLNIDLNNNVKNLIIETTTADEITINKRDAKENIMSWKNRLTIDEIELIKKETYQVWTKLYSLDSWN